MGASGSVEVNFGAFPGQSDASATIIGQAAILAGSLVEAWIMPRATADHSEDEHTVEPLRAFALNIVAGTGFTVRVVNDNRLSEPIELIPHNTSIVTASATTIAVKLAEPSQRSGALGGALPRVYGRWTVGWVWL